MVATKDILHQIDIIYDGVELNKIKALRDYGDFLCDVIDSEARHTVAITLHTGSIYYHAMAIAVAVLGCLFYHNTDTEELIQSLSVGDIIILDGQRVRFQGTIDGSTVGFRSGTKCFKLDINGGTRYIPFEKLKEYHILRYQGNSETLGGQGIKGKMPLKVRKDFLSTFVKDKAKAEISTEIDHSIAVIIDRGTAEQFYKGISIAYNNKTVALSDIATATYYSEDESYQIGNNPTKEEPIIKFYSKVSVCRETVIDDRQKRIIGCFISDEKMWATNSEAHDISDRKGLKFVALAGKTHYTNFIDWFEASEYRYYACVPETVKNLADDAEFTFKTQPLKKELSLFANRNISDLYAISGTDSRIVSDIKRRLLKIKQDGIASDKKDNFIITSYFLLNLCRSAFFPLCYCEIAYQKNLINWTIADKENDLKEYISTLFGELKEDAQFVFNGISHLVSELYSSNPKSDILKEKIIGRQVGCIVVTKAYYEHLFKLWMDDCKIINRPRIVTVTAFENSKEIFSNVIFSTAYYDFSFNPYASFNYASSEVLLYEYEDCQARYLIKTAGKGRKLLHEKNYLAYDIVIEPEEEIVPEYIEDVQFECEMDKVAQELQLKSAYRYVSTSNANSDGTVKIEKIFTFASGSVGYFTKYYKGYRIRGEEVREVDLDELSVGDSMVFTKQSENKDIVDVLLNQLLEEQYKNTAYPEYYRLSVCWKEALREVMKKAHLSYQDISSLLSLHGCEKHQVTIRSWLLEETHIVGPRSESDFDAILKLVGLDVLAADVKRGCDEIRRLRMRILDLIGKAIINGMSADNKDSISKLVYEKAENLTQIEQITSINDSGTNASVPVYMANKPCNT